MQAVNTLVDADDEERMTRLEMRNGARNWRLRSDGRKKGANRYKSPLAHN